MTDAIRQFPKVDLHDHLDGGLRVSTVIELAQSKGVALPSYDPDALSRWITAECAGSLDRYLVVGDLMVDLLSGDPAALYRAAREFALDLAVDGVVYSEVRWAPAEMATRGISLTQALAAVSAGLEDGVTEVRSQGAALEVRQILCSIRTTDRSSEIARLALDHREAGVAAFDLAGAEDGFPPSHHRAALDMLAADGMPVTLHAGEASGVRSIQSALDDGRALRIGHGVRIVEDISDDDRLGPVARALHDSHIALEVCPSSNLQTKASVPDIDHHPFDRLRRLGFAVTVSPDNRLLSDTSVTEELALLASTFGYDMSDIAQFQLTAAQSAFLPPLQRDVLVETIRTAISAAV